MCFILNMKIDIFYTLNNVRVYCYYCNSIRLCNHHTNLVFNTQTVPVGPVKAVAVSQQYRHEVNLETVCVILCLSDRFNRPNQ